MTRSFFQTAFGIGFAALALCYSSARAQLLPLDATFGTAGLATTAMSPGAVDDIPHAVHVQPDGKIVVGGVCGVQFCVARYLANGTLDVSFGQVSTPGKALLSRLGEDRAYATALQPDGKIVMAGDCRVPLGLTISFCVLRLTANGLPDSTFGDSGWVEVPMASGYDGARAIAIQPDDKLVISGDCSEAPTFVRSFCHIRLLPNGALDTTFNTTGKAYTPYTGGGLSANHKFVTASAIRSDGMIFVVGYSESASDDRILVLRLTPAGTAGFWHAIDFDVGDDRAFGVAVQASGRVLVSGECGNRACMLRLNADDSGLDANYGTSGKRLVEDVSVTGERVGAVTLFPDGSSLFAGWSNPISGICNGSVRWVSSGGDRQGGVNVAGCAPMRAITSQLDLKPVVVHDCFGSGTQRDFCVYRYQAPPVEFRNCSLDVDGDGKVVATTDTLISTRVALGFTGAAVLNGVTFEPHALRKTWPDIRAWMINHCAIPLP